MFYRRAGIRHLDYRHERQLWPLPFDRLLVGIVVALALAAPFIVDQLYLIAYLLPWLIWSSAALGLNLLMGGAGQIHLGYGAVMAIGAYTGVHLVRFGAPLEWRCCGRDRQCGDRRRLRLRGVACKKPLPRDGDHCDAIYRRLRHHPYPGRQRRRHGFDRQCRRCASSASGSKATCRLTIWRCSFARSSHCSC